MNNRKRMDPNSISGRCKLKVCWLLLFTLASGCEKSTKAPEEEPDAQEQVAELTLSLPVWKVPSDGLPPEIVVQASNNNVDIEYHDDRLFMAWRTGPYHFASSEVEMIVVSSEDHGNTWELEHIVDMDTDVREPRLLSFQGELQLIYFEAGQYMLAFDPQHVWRTLRTGAGEWSEPELVVEGAEVPWDIKVRNGKAWMTSYIGEHYGEPGSGDVHILFRESDDGHTWNFVEGTPEVYSGGASEAAIEFDAQGNLWAVTRNEDGDTSGFGSLLCFAPVNALSEWECPDTSDPRRFDSPEMFRHEDEIYMIARRNKGELFGENPDMVAYSASAKTTALYRIDQDERRVSHIQDLPGAGDTAFASVIQTGPHTFLFANYTSPLDEPEISWIDAQQSEKGTQIYFMTLEFPASE